MPFLQHQQQVLPYAEASIPTNIRQSNPPNKLPRCAFASNPYSKSRRFLPHTLHYISPIYPPPTPRSKHSAAAAKSYALFHTQLSLILHLYALPAWQYTLNDTCTSFNQHTVSSLHYRPCTPAHCLCKPTTKCLLKDDMTHCSTYTSPDLPPTLAAPFALCKGIHSNIYPPIKSSYPSTKITLSLLSKHNPNSKSRRFLSHGLHYITPTYLRPPPTRCTRCS